MKRPSITPKDIGLSIPAQDGSVAIHLRDANGNDQTVNLSAKLRSRLGEHLLSGPLLEMAHTEPMALLVTPTRTRAYENRQGETAIELTIAPGRAIHISLNALQANALRLQLGEIATPPANQSH